MLRRFDSIRGTLPLQRKNSVSTRRTAGTEPAARRSSLAESLFAGAVSFFLVDAATCRRSPHQSRNPGIDDPGSCSFQSIACTSRPAISRMCLPRRLPGLSRALNRPHRDNRFRRNLPEAPDSPIGRSVRLIRSTWLLRPVDNGGVRQAGFVAHGK